MIHQKDQEDQEDPMEETYQIQMFLMNLKILSI